MILYNCRRGGVTKKNWKILGKFRKGGGSKKKQTKIPNFNLGIWKTEGGGLNFSEMSEFQLFCNYFAIILQYYLYMKCLKFKIVLIWSEGGGSAFSKNV